MKNILLISIILFNCSCARTLMILNGIKVPRYESEERILKFASKNNIDKNQIVFINDSASFKKIMKLFARTPGIIVTDKNYHRLDFESDKATCPAPVENQLSAICEKSNSLKFYTDTSMIQLLNLKNSNHQTLLSTNADYYIFYIWNTSMGKTIKNPQSWDKQLKEFNDCNYASVWLNNNYMASWYNEKPGKKMRFSVKGTTKH